MAASLQDIEVSLRVYGDCAGIQKRTFGREAAVLRTALPAVPGDRRNQASFQVDLTNTPVVQIIYIKVFALSVQRKAVDVAELRIERLPAISAKTRLASSRKGGNDAGLRIDFTDAAIERIRDQ